MKKFTLLFFLSVTTSVAQSDSSKFKTVVPGDHYTAGPIKRLFLGDHWRDLWGTPIRVEELDLVHFAGGLTPTERGGGFQTRSLRFIGKDGKEYKFRSLDKDPTRILPDELQDSFVEEVVQDQISWSHPYSALIAAPFVDAAGILQAAPQIVILPKSELLGPFENDFGGMLGTLEENPDDKDEIVFANADKIKGTYSLLKELDDDNDEVVDAREYLKARIIDIFLGDWDRHVDQWKWAGFKSDGKRIWRPIPRDRDQALAKIDGLIPWGITLAIKQIESYENVFPLIDDMTWSGRHLDRKFLSRLSRTEWDSVTGNTVGLLTDSLISIAVHRMPTAMYALEGKNIESKLRERRDHLREASIDFYEICAKYVDIHCSNKNEYAEIIRINDNTVDVTVWKRDKETGTKKGEPVFYRRFFTNETKEIRLYLKDGDDRASITGEVDESIEIHIDGGEGKDLIIDRSKVNGLFLGTMPIPSAETKSFIYDSGKKTAITMGSGSLFINRAFDTSLSDTALFEPYRDYGHDFRPLGIASFNSADGIIFGGGLTLYAYKLKHDPYFYKMDLSAAYATGHNAFRVDYQGIFRTYDPDLSYILHVRLSGIEVLRYYGIGNEVSIPIPSENKDYYQVQQGQYLFHPQMKYRFWDRSSFRAGMLVKHSDIQLHDSTYIKTRLPYGASDMTIACIHGGVEIDSRDHDLFPTRGMYLQSDASFYPQVMNNTFDFTRARVDLRWYSSMEIFSQTIFAFRFFGEKIFGRYPFYEASYLGGTESVRGFEKQRFSGDASISMHGETRFYLGKIKMLVPVTIGGTFYGETGRVFLRGERSDLWHSGLGVGLWCYAVNKDITFSFSIARSREEFEEYLSIGFTF